MCDHAQVRVASVCSCQKVGDRHGHRADVCYAPCVQLCCDADWLRVQRVVLRIGSVCNYTKVGDVPVVKGLIHNRPNNNLVVIWSGSELVNDQITTSCYLVISFQLP